MAKKIPCDPISIHRQKRLKKKMTENCVKGCVNKSPIVALKENSFEKLYLLIYPRFVQNEMS